MAIYYLDSSALVKRYLWEPGSRWLRVLLEQPGQDSFASIGLIAVEVICALTRAERDGRIGRAKRDKVSKLFLAEAEDLFDTTPVSANILQNANELALRHPLRAYDAVHLATALQLAERLMWSGLPAPIFVSADANLLAAARAEGLATEDPNEHE
jgi:predicted nucleic acid-binding protein